MINVEAMVLSHGHSDHFGGFDKLIAMVGKEGIELIVHPAAYKYPQYVKFKEMPE